MCRIEPTESGAWWNELKGLSAIGEKQSMDLCVAQLFSIHHVWLHECIQAKAEGQVQDKRVCTATKSFPNERGMREKHDKLRSNPKDDAVKNIPSKYIKKECFCLHRFGVSFYRRLTERDLFTEALCLTRLKIFVEYSQIEHLYAISTLRKQVFPICGTLDLCQIRPKTAFH